MDNRNQLRKTYIVSVPVVIMTVIQFTIVLIARSVVGQDNIGLISTIFHPLVYLSSFFLIISVVTVLNNKSAGLFDLPLVALTLIASFFLM
jgi:hypothetical protein